MSQSETGCFKLKQGSPCVPKERIGTLLFDSRKTLSESFRRADCACCGNIFKRDCCLRHSFAMRPNGRRPADLAGRPSSKCQSACKPGSVWPACDCGRDGHSSATPVARRLKQPTRTTDLDRPTSAPLARMQMSRRSYSVLLPVGFAVPSALPQPRCALAAPFHPCRDMRHGGLLFCGTFPEKSSPLARKTIPAGRYPAPFVHGARTFLPGALSSLAGAAVQPTDRSRNGDRKARRQVSLAGAASGAVSGAMSKAIPEAVSSDPIAGSS